PFTAGGPAPGQWRGHSPAAVKGSRYRPAAPQLGPLFPVMSRFRAGASRMQTMIAGSSGCIEAKTARDHEPAWCEAWLKFLPLGYNRRSVTLRRSGWAGPGRSGAAPGTAAAASRDKTGISPDLSARIRPAANTGCPGIPPWAGDSFPEAAVSPWRLP